jgi:hypothetical protein
MKSTFVLFSILMITLASCMPKDLPTSISQKQDFALVKLSHMTTKDELQEIQQKLAEQGIGFNYEGSTFFEDNKLQKLSLMVSVPGGHSGRTTADIVALQFRYFGFLYQKGGRPVFKIGEMTGH